MTQDPVVLGGRYELVEIIGRGGMAEVWRGADQRLHRDVAVKRLRVDLASDDTFQARFRREAQSAAGLNHPNIVAVYDTGEETDAASGVSLPYIVMELVEGSTLREILREGRKILPEKALEFTSDVLDALNYSHRSGIIHRDIKPGNVMITRAGMVKVMDFGIARAVSDTSATMTQTAAVIGTAHYLSPEQARGETVDNRSDIYSTGCLLYELLTGRPPFQGDSPISVAYQHVRENPTPPSQLDAEVTPGMDAIVLKSLAKNPNDRYQTAREMRDDIQRLLAGDEVTATVALPAPIRAPQPAPLPDAVATQHLAAAVGPITPARASTPSGVRSPQTPLEEAPVRRAAPDTGDDRASRKLSPGAWVVIGLVTVLLIVGGFVTVRLLNPGQPETRAVPNVQGQIEQAARSALENAGFELGTVTQTNGAADSSVNTVIAQDPQAQSQQPPGTKVDITINVGPKQGTLPSVLGQTVAQAMKTLNNAGFTNIATVDADPKDEPVDAVAGNVTAMDPQPNSNADSDQQITLTIATGTSPLPNLVGQVLTQDEASELLTQAGFTLGDYTQVAGDPSDPAGKVLTQTPSGDPSVNLVRGTKVNLEVSRGPVTVPTDLVGKTSDAATAELVQAGFDSANITVQTISDEAIKAGGEPVDYKAGQVISVSPTGQQDAATKITLTVAAGKAVVPNFTGMTQNEASGKAAQSGFSQANLVFQTAPSDNPAGQIIDQIPARDQVAPKDSTITLTLSSGSSSGSTTTP